MRFFLAFVIAAAVWSVLKPGFAVAKPPAEITPGAFSHSHLNPQELQFGCGGTSDKEEEALAALLKKDDRTVQFMAARGLWKGRSRRHASEVLKYLAASPPGGEEFRAFQREVDAALRPDSILKELKSGDYLWGTWLAFLRPHKDLVPTLLAGLKDRPEELSETILALGNSGDTRAVTPLLEMLKRKDYAIPGWAAQALGYLGDPKTEDALIAALATDNGWRQVKASGALEKFGTTKALPALEKVANTKGYTGALNVRGCAMYAVVAIERRERKMDPNIAEAEVHKPTTTLRGHAEYVWAVTFSPDGKYLASVSDDKTTRLWNVETEKGTAAYAGHARQMTKVAFVADGKQFATAGHGDNGSIQILESSSGKFIRSIPAAKGAVDSMIVSSDGKLIASYGTPEGKPEAIHIWDATSGKLVNTVPKSHGALAFSPDSNLLAMVGAESEDDVEIHLWNLKTQKITARLRGHIGVGYAAFSPDGKTIITGGDWTVRSWNVETGKEIFKVRGDGEIDGVSFNPDGKTIAFGEQGGSVHISDATTGKKLKTLNGRGPIAYSPNGKQLATGSEDRTSIFLWDLNALENK